MEARVPTTLEPGWAFRGFFVALICLDKQRLGVFRGFSVAFSWFFRGFSVAFSSFWANFTRAYSPWRSLLTNSLQETFFVNSLETGPF